MSKRRELFPKTRESNKKHFKSIPREDNSKYRPNYALIGIVCFFLIAGLLMVYSASSNSAYQINGDTFFFLKRQLIWIFLGCSFAFIVYKLPIKIIHHYSFWIIIAAFFLMLLLLPETLLKINLPLSLEKNGAVRWLDFGFFELQPAEIMKFAFIVFIARWYSLADKEKRNIEQWIKRYEYKQNIYLILSLMYRFLPFVILGLTGALIMLQKDLDTFAIIFLIFLSMFFFSGSGKQHNIATLLLGVGAAIGAVIASVIEPYRRERIAAFMEILLKGEPSQSSKLGESFQVWNGLIAIGSGGLFGVGYGDSRQKLFFLQNSGAYTDSIFAIIAEEFGLFGSVIVIVGFLFLLSVGMKIAKNAPNRFSFFLAIGITSWICIQAFLNIAANLALIPFGGMPLPFFTYGGSNTIMTLIGVGVLLNISKQKVTNR